jgi:dTDP-4-dehydrorhamnose 3,5-epimerase
VRTVSGRMIDIILDIRKGAPTLGKIIMHDMPADRTTGSQEWIWVPAGFAHGNVFPEDSVIEYLCSGEYSQGCEAGISPFAPDIDWTLCDAHLKETFQRIASSTNLVTDKDRNGFSLHQWLGDERSNNFMMQELR